MLRLICLLVVWLGLVSAHADELADVPGLNAAIDRHAAALTSGDRSAIAATVTFPHVQFGPSGGVHLINAEADIADRGAAQRQWRVSSRQLVSYEQDIAIVRVGFETTGADAGRGVGAGLWCYVRKDGVWLINWRHYLGREVTHLAVGH